MDHFFIGKAASTLLSAPKHRDHSAIQDAGVGLSTDAEISSERSLFGNLVENQEQRTSDDSGIDTSRSDTESDAASDDPGHLPAISLRINEIGKKAQDLVEKINEHRAMDQDIMNTFHDKLMEKVTEVFQRVKDHMFSSYEGNSRVIESQLLELSTVLERSSQLVSELQDASQTLAAINMGLRQLPQQ